MRLTPFTDDCLRMASTPDRACSSADLGDKFGFCRNHLARIMQRLMQAGMVETRRGGGGACTHGGRCLPKARMRSAKAALLADCDRTSLAEIALTPRRAA